MMCEHGGEHFSWHFVCNKCGMPGSDAILETALAAANARAELAERQLEETRNVRNALFISLEAANARIAELEEKNVWFTTNGKDLIKLHQQKAEQAEAQNKRMRESLRSLMALCEYGADFRNGNVCQGIDEGNVMADRIIAEAKAALEEKND